MDNLFAFFDAMNAENYDYVDSMTDEEVKALSPFVLLMWANGAVDNPHIHTILTDTYVNPYVFSLSKHPRLLLKLMVTANGGIDRTRYKFKKSVTKEQSNLIKIIAEHYQCGYNEAKEIKELLSKDDLKELESLYGK
jgi:hypothetical protein